LQGRIDGDGVTQLFYTEAREFLAHGLYEWFRVRHI
jgi:hypothetical protein